MWVFRFTGNGGNPAGYYGTLEELQNNTLHSFNYGADVSICNGYIKCQYNTNMVVKAGKSCSVFRPSYNACSHYDAGDNVYGSTAYTNLKNYSYTWVFPD